MKPSRYRPELEELGARLLPSFTPLGVFPVGKSPQALAVGDFNGDGKPDLATVNVGGNTLSILLNRGAAGFSVAPEPVDGEQPVAAAVGDFNGDGKQDIAVANAISSKVDLRMGNGTGGFSPGRFFAVGENPLAVAVGDFNGDDKQDLATANSTGNSVSILLGDGAGNFTRAQDVFVVGTSPCSLAVADFDGDGKQDIATANFDSRSVSLLMGLGGGVFYHGHDYDVGTHPTDVVVGNFNGDNKPDLAVAVAGDYKVTAILLGTGGPAGSFTAAPNVPAISGPPCVAVGDFNGDGRQDLAIADVVGLDVGIRYGNGNGTFTIQPDVSAGGETNPIARYPVFVAVADFNGDGRPDIATANEAGSATVLLNTGSTAAADPPDASLPPPPPPQVAAVAFHKKGLGRVCVWDAATGALHGVLTPFAGFRGHLRLDLLDVTGDGAADVIVRALIHGKRKRKVFDGVTLARMG
jgi:FG-GAP-like repeat